MSDLGSVPDAAATHNGVQEDDLDMLQLMASLERTTSATSAEQHARAAAGVPPSGAAEALAALHASIGSTGGAAARNMKAARPKLSGAAAATLSNALSRHPALQLFSSLKERVDVWAAAVSSSMAYEEDDGGSTDVADAEDDERRAQPAATPDAGRADQAVLSASGTSGVRNAFAYVQQLSDELEHERMKAVFRGMHSGRDVTSSIEGTVHARYNVDPRKGVAYPGDSAAVPQRCWFHCLFGPLMSPEYADWAPPSPATTRDGSGAAGVRHAAQLHWGLEASRLAEVGLPLVSASLAQAVERTSRNPYDTSAWLHVLETAMDVPLSESRSTWHLATFLFPTSGPVVLAYLRAEQAALQEIHTSLELTSRSATNAHNANASGPSVAAFKEGLDEETAKHLFRAQLRILNTYYRHLPRCASWELYDMFLSFLQANVADVDQRTIDNIFRLALEHHVGNCVDSTPLWLRYLEWRAHKTTQIVDKQKFVRTMFHRILRTPLYGLQEVRERYDSFETAEVRGARFRLEDELERSMTRAKSIAADRVELLKPLLRQRLVPASQRRDDSRVDGIIMESELPTVLPHSTARVYLPRPFRPNADVPFPRAHSTTLTHQDAGYQDACTRWLLPEEELLEEQQTWLMLHRALAAEIDTNYSPAQTEEGHFRRVAFHLRLRLSLFPHESVCWLEYANILLYGLPRQRPRADFGPTGLVGSAAPPYLGAKSAQTAVEVLEDALAMYPHHTHTTVVLAEMCRMRLGSPRRGDRYYRCSLEACRARLLSKWLPMCDALLHAAQRSCGSSLNTQDNAQQQHQHHHVRAVDHTLAVFHERYATLHSALTTFLEHTVVLAGNWLSYSRAAYPKTAAAQTRLVARYLVQDLELFAMVMGSLKRMMRLAVTMRCEHAFSPRRFLDTLNAFCSHWVMIELHQLHCPDAALAILGGWAELYKSMITSTAQQRWTLADCGVDERFFARANEIGRSWAKRMASIKDEAAQDPLLPHIAGSGTGSVRRVREVLEIVAHLEALFPHSPLSPSGNNDDDHESTAVQRQLAVFESTIAPRRWIMCLCQKLDPVGVFVKSNFPALIRRCANPLSPDGAHLSIAVAENAEHTTDKDAQQSWWAVGLGGVASAGASETIRSYFGVMPVHMNGVAESSNSEASSRRTHWLAEDMCAERWVQEGHAGGGPGPDHSDDLDAVYPDTSSWQALPPRPQVSRGRGGRGGRGGRLSAGSPQGALSHRSVNDWKGDSNSDDDDLLDVDLPSRGTGDRAGGANDGGSNLLAIGDSLMTMSAVMEKRAKQTLGRRVLVQHAAFHHSLLPREGLMASLDLAACDRRVEAMAEEERGGSASATADAATTAPTSQPPTSLGRRIETVHATLQGGSKTVAVDHARGKKGRRAPPKATPQQFVSDAFFALSRPNTFVLANAAEDGVDVHRRGPLCALESLLCEGLPSRYSFGAAFDASVVNKEWLLGVLQQTTTLRV